MPLPPRKTLSRHSRDGEGCGARGVVLARSDVMHPVMNREEDLFSSWRGGATTIEPHRLLEAVCAREAKLARRADLRNFVENVGVAVGLATSLLYAALFDQLTIRLACLLLATTLIPYGLTLHQLAGGKKKKSLMGRAPAS